MKNVWIWQRMLSPHIAGLAKSLHEKGHKIQFVIEEYISPDRAGQGWSVPILEGVTISLLKDIDSANELINHAPADTIHICQGVRNNGLIGLAQKLLRKRKIKYWVILETINNSGFSGALRKILYSIIFNFYKNDISGVLAIGHKTKNWLISAGVCKDKIYEFAYFMNVQDEKYNTFIKNDDTYRFIFVGRLISIKNVSLLIRSLSKLNNYNYELLVVGDGSLKNKLVKQSKKYMSGRVKWVGQVSSSLVPAYIASSDCLVLPSLHDGWGAVVSEALMLGTPVICSNECGSAGVVEVSPLGFVFNSKSTIELQQCLLKAVNRGSVSDSTRSKISSWASLLNADSGANYLLKILDSSNDSNIYPPWLNQAPLNQITEFYE